MIVRKCRFRISYIPWVARLIEFESDLPFVRCEADSSVNTMLSASTYEVTRSLFTQKVFAVSSSIKAKSLPQYSISGVAHRRWMRSVDMETMIY